MRSSTIFKPGTRRRDQAGLNDFYAQRRGFLRGGLRGWFHRHPFVSMLIVLVVLGWITWMEAARMEGARYTVAHGWGTGLAAGTAASLGLSALWGAILRATRSRPVLRAQTQWPLALAMMLGWGFCFRTTMASSSPGAAPYVITTGIAVGEIAYVATCSACCMAVLVRGGLRLWRRTRLPYGSD